MPPDDPHGSVPDEREIEAEPHDGCLERACECVQDEIASLRRLNQVLAPRYPMVNVPVDTLDAISKRAEDAEAALDRVRDARRNEETAQPAKFDPATRSPSWSRDEPARSPQGEDHEAGIDAAWHAIWETRARSYQPSQAPPVDREQAEAGIAAYLSRVSPSPERDTVRLVEALRAIAAQKNAKPAAAIRDWCADHAREALAEFPDAPARDARRDTVAVEDVVRWLRKWAEEKEQDIPRRAAILTAAYFLLAEFPDAPARDARPGTVAVEDAARAFVDAWWEFDGLAPQDQYNAVAERVQALDEALAAFPRTATGDKDAPGTDEP
jgi:hypothetical protein